MKIFLDLSLINLLFLNVSALHFCEKIIKVKSKLGKIIAIGFLLSLKLIAIYFPFAIALPFSILYDALILFVFYKKNFFKHLILLYIYLSTICFFINLTFKDETGFKNLILIIKSVIGAWAILLDVIFYFAVDLSILIVDRLFHLKDFKMDVLLSSSKENRQVKAYYDSGNTLTIEKSPVIFIKKDTIKFDIQDEIHPSLPLTIPFKYEGIYRVKIHMGISSRSYAAYAITVSKNEDLYGCDCLLNVFLRR